MNKQKHVITIQDISCLGRCSITVALPVLSAAGIETTILPTAILSTHTGGFTNFTVRDLQDDIVPIVEHWLSLNDVNFDNIYTGYLASTEQIKLIKKVIAMVKEKHNISVMVDPAMADNGKMYPAFNDEFAKDMLKLCKEADIIVPNLTEACKMTGIEYQSGVTSKEYIEKVVNALAKENIKRIVLTSVCLEEGLVGTCCYDNGNIEYYFKKIIPGYYHGSGDVYSSSLLASYLKGKNLIESVKIATDYTCACIERTRNEGSPVRYGVNFEEELATFIKLVK